MKSLLNWVIKNLEFFPLIGALVFLYEVPFDWRFFLTIALVAFCSGISTSYNIRNSK